MGLVPTVDLLQRARADGYGIGAFNVIGLEHAQAIVRAAELERAPAILQISQNTVIYHQGRLAPIGQACRALADQARVPVALHLDHATTHDLCAEALAVGFGSVMFDASALEFEANVARTAELATWVHGRGAGLEAELGVVGGKDGVVSTAEGQTDPAKTRRYVERTGVDALAVAVGTTHAMTEQTASIDLDLIARLRAVVDIPLVLHGGSGVPDADLAEAVRRGITKVNIATQLNRAYTQQVRTFLTDDQAAVDPRTYLAPARAAMIDVVRRYIALIGGSGRAGATPNGYPHEATHRGRAWTKGAP